MYYSINRLICLHYYTGAKKSAASDMLFDDDDMLGSMGLESPQLSGRKSTLLLPSDSPPETGARSVLDNLLQGGKSEKKTAQSEKPADFMSPSLKTPGRSTSNSSFVSFIL